MGPWNFPAIIQKRLIKFLLKRTIGQYLDVEKQDTNLLDVTIGSQGGSLQLLALGFKINNINELLLQFGLQLVSGSIDCLRLQFPAWMEILQGKRVSVMISGLQMHFRVLTESEGADRSLRQAAEDFLSQSIYMTTSIHIADDFLKEEPVPSTLPSDADPTIEAQDEEKEGDDGLSSLAQYIDGLLSKIEFKFEKIQLSLWHNAHMTGPCLKLELNSGIFLEPFDSLSSSSSSSSPTATSSSTSISSTEQQKQTVSMSMDASFSRVCKQLLFTGLSLAFVETSITHLLLTDKEMLSEHSIRLYYDKAFGFEPTIDTQQFELDVEIGPLVMSVDYAALIALLPSLDRLSVQTLFSLFSPDGRKETVTQSDPTLPGPSKKDERSKQWEDYERSVQHAYSESTASSNEAQESIGEELFYSVLAGTMATQHPRDSFHSYSQGESSTSNLIFPLTAMASQEDVSFSNASLMAMQSIVWRIRISALEVACRGLPPRNASDSSESENGTRHARDKTGGCSAVCHLSALDMKNAIDKSPFSSSSSPASAYNADGEERHDTTFNAQCHTLSVHMRDDETGTIYFSCESSKDASSHWTLNAFKTSNGTRCIAAECHGELACAFVPLKAQAFSLDSLQEPFQLFYRGLDPQLSLSLSLDQCRLSVDEYMLHGKRVKCDVLSTSLALLFQHLELIETPSQTSLFSISGSPSADSKLLLELPPKTGMRKKPCPAQSWWQEGASRYLFSSVRKWDEKNRVLPPTLAHPSQIKVYETALAEESSWRLWFDLQLLVVHVKAKSESSATGPDWMRAHLSRFLDQTDTRGMPWGLVHGTAKALTIAFTENTAHLPATRSRLTFELSDGVYGWMSISLADQKKSWQDMKLFNMVVSAWSCAATNVAGQTLLGRNHNEKNADRDMFSFIYYPQSLCMASRLQESIFSIETKSEASAATVGWSRGWCHVKLGSLALDWNELYDTLLTLFFSLGTERTKEESESNPLSALETWLQGLFSQEHCDAFLGFPLPPVYAFAERMAIRYAPIADAFPALTLFLPLTRLVIQEPSVEDKESETLSLHVEEGEIFLVEHESHVMNRIMRFDWISAHVILPSLACVSHVLQLSHYLVVLEGTADSYGWLYEILSSWSDRLHSHARQLMSEAPILHLAVDLASSNVLSEVEPQAFHLEPRHQEAESFAAQESQPSSLVESWFREPERETMSQTGFAAPALLQMEDYPFTDEPTRDRDDKSPPAPAVELRQKSPSISANSPTVSGATEIVDIFKDLHIEEDYFSTLPESQESQESARSATGPFKSCPARSAQWKVRSHGSYQFLLYHGQDRAGLRDTGNYMEIRLTDMQVYVDVMPLDHGAAHESDPAIKTDAEAQGPALSVWAQMGLVEILDGLQSSTWHKYLTRQWSKESTPSSDPMWILSLEGWRNEPSLEYRLKLYSSDLRLYIDQDASEFLAHFVEKTMASARVVPKDEAETDASRRSFFQKVVVAGPIQLILDYKPKHVQMGALLREGKQEELFHLFTLEDANFSLCPVSLTGVRGWSEVGAQIMDCWSRHLSSNTQWTSLASALPPIKSLLKMGTGVKDLLGVVAPPLQPAPPIGSRAPSLKTRLSRGTSSFLTNTAAEGLDLSARLAVGTSHLLERADRYFSSAPNSPSYLPGSSPNASSYAGTLSRRALGPKNASSAFKMAREEWAIPKSANAQRPSWRGLSDAVSNTLLGLSASAQPERQKAFQDKYKSLPSKSTK